MFTDQVYNVWYSTNNESKIMKEKKKILTIKILIFINYAVKGFSFGIAEDLNALRLGYDHFTLIIRNVIFTER